MTSTMNEEIQKTSVRICENKGNGLCASSSIRQGETILYLPEITQETPDKYSIEISPGVHVNCADSLVGAINHSCRPNAAVKDNRIVAWACIAADEEITIDYKKTESSLAEPFECRCGFRECRGQIK